MSRKFTTLQATVEMIVFAPDEAFIVVPTVPETNYSSAIIHYLKSLLSKNFPLSGENGFYNYYLR